MTRQIWHIGRRIIAERMFDDVQKNEKKRQLLASEEITEILRRGMSGGYVGG